MGVVLVAVVAALSAASCTAQHPRPVRSTASGSPPAVVPDCRQGDLDARYVGGGDGGQTFNGDVVVRNVGPSACRIAGHVHLAATLVGGDPDPRVVAVGPGDKPVDMVLPARTPHFAEGSSEPGKYFDVLIGAPEFTSYGDCESSASRLRSIAPATFTVRVGALMITVPDNDPLASQNAVLRGCDGTFFLAIAGPS